MSVGALQPFSPKPQHVQELKEIFQLFNRRATDPLGAKLADRMYRSHGDIPDQKFICYLQQAIVLTRKPVPHSGERSTMCVQYAANHLKCTIPFLLANVTNPKLNIAKFREMLPLLNETMVHAFRSYEKAKQKSAEGADLLARHLTSGHQEDPCQVCQSISYLSKKSAEKREMYELIQKYVAYMLNWAERKLMTARETECEPWIFATGLLIGAVIGGYLGTKYLPAAVLGDDTLTVGITGGAYMGAMTLKRLKRILTEPLLLDRHPRSEEKEAEWITLTDRVRYRFEEISSGYLRRTLGLSSFTLGEVEITFGKMDAVICLFNLAEDWRIYGGSLFELRRHFWDRLTQKNALKPAECLYILETLKTSKIGRGMLHFQTRGFFGPSYSRFFDDIVAYCRKEIRADPASQLAVVSFEEDNPL